jgi:hypothetical protein
MSDVVKVEMKRRLKNIRAIAAMRWLNLLLMIFGVTGFASGQNPLTLYHLKNIPQSLTINPAMVPDAKVFVGFPVFSSIYSGVNFELTGADLIQEHNGKYITLTNADFDYDKLYKKCWPDVKEIVCNWFVNDLQTGILSIEQRLGVLSLIPKPNKDLRYLTSWRLSSLLNTEYKILTKALGNILQLVVDELVNFD